MLEIVICLDKSGRRIAEDVSETVAELGGRVEGVVYAIFVFFGGGSALDC